MPEGEMFQGVSEPDNSWNGFLLYILLFTNED